MLALAFTVAGVQESLAKPDAAKAARRAWMDAAAEKQAAWQAERAAIRNVDLSGGSSRGVIIVQGTPAPEEYHMHPTTALLGGSKTMFCVWNIGHGSHVEPKGKSADGGLAWTRIDETLPPNYGNFRNCPSIYRLTDPQGRARLWVFSACTASPDKVLKE